MVFKFQLGEIKMIVVSDGVFPVTKKFFFANTPEQLIKDVPSNFDAPLNFLLIEVNDKKILVDAGFGCSHQPVAGNLVERLKLEGVYPEHIDTVIVTHGHMDDIGGLTQDKNPVFFNAENIISQYEWNYWEQHPESEEFKTMPSIKGKTDLHNFGR